MLRLTNVFAIKYPPFKFDSRPGWHYVGWIKNPPIPEANTSFSELCGRARESDHGEERAVDIYDNGAVCFVRESKCSG